jgi:hypothetical protein
VGTDPQSGSSELIMRAMADPVEMKLLHMVTADPARTPTFAYFANPAYFLFAGAPNCNLPCVTQQFGFAWSHGDFQNEIVNTWLGMAGPGVVNLGVDGQIWSDHTDIRPTILALAGLHDDYAHDGRVLIEALDPAALPLSMRIHMGTAVRMAQTYKQINAPVGQLGLTTLARSTTALAGDDATYTSIENQLSTLTDERNAVASQMIAMLEAAAFDGRAIDQKKAKELIAQGQALLSQ